MKPETRFAKSGDVHIAYQVTGEGRGSSNGWTTCGSLVAGFALGFADKGTHVLEGVPAEWGSFTAICATGER